MSKSIVQVFFSLLAKILSIMSGLVVILYFINRLFKTDLGIWTGPAGSMSFLPTPESWQDTVLYVFMFGISALVCYAIQKAIEHKAWLKAKPGRGVLVVVGALVGLGVVSWGIISYGNSLAAKNTGGKLFNGIENNVPEATLLELIRNADAPQTTASVNAFEAAARVDNFTAIPILIQHGYTINARTKETYKGADYNQTVLMMAARFYSPKAVKALLENGAEVNLQDSTGKTALHYALEGLIEEIDIEKIRLLLAAGAKIDIADYQKKTPQDIARENFVVYPGSPEYYKEITKLLGV